VNSDETPVKAKAMLLDPATLEVVWMNEATASGLAEKAGGTDGEATIEALVPMAESLGVREALRSVADTGVARHLQTKLVSTAQGSMAVVISMYRLPHGPVLLVMENAWQPAKKRIGSRGTTGRSR